MLNTRIITKRIVFTLIETKRMYGTQWKNKRLIVYSVAQSMLEG